MPSPEPTEAPGSTDRILVGIDGSPPSLAALRWAVRQAGLTGSPLDIVTAWEWPGSYGWAPPVPSDYDPVADAQRMLDETIGAIRVEQPGVECRSRVIEGHPAPVLVEASQNADLLVVGNRGHGEFSGMLIGSVSEHCVANAHCPVVVVRGRD